MRRATSSSSPSTARCSPASLLPSSRARLRPRPLTAPSAGRRWSMPLRACVTTLRSSSAISRGRCAMRKTLTSSSCRSRVRVSRASRRRRRALQMRLPLRSSPHLVRMPRLAAAAAATTTSDAASVAASAAAAAEGELAAATGSMWEMVEHAAEREVVTRRTAAVAGASVLLGRPGSSRRVHWDPRPSVRPSVHSDPRRRLNRRSPTGAVWRQPFLPRPILLASHFGGRG